MSKGTITFEGKGPYLDSREARKPRPLVNCRCSEFATVTWICPHPKTEVVYKYMASEVLILVL